MTTADPISLSQAKRLAANADTIRLRATRAADLETAAAFDGAVTVGVTGGTSTPIEDLESVARRIYELAGTSERRAAADALAHAAVTEVAEPAYRSTSLSLA